MLQRPMALRERLDEAASDGTESDDADAELGW
jgi:hypothetical protein